MYLRTLLITGLLAAAAPMAAARSDEAPLQTVDNLDLERYQGRWYEIARLENEFQEKCARNVRVRYSLRPDGAMEVVNQCDRGDGSLMSAQGLARKQDADGKASKLEVRFAPAWLSFLPMVWGDYYVMDVADDYSWAVVGTPDRDYFWILSRSPRLAETVVRGIVERAEQKGYDLDGLIRTQHSNIPGSTDQD